MQVPPVREQRTLGPARGAAGEQHEVRVVLVHRNDRHHFRATVARLLSGLPPVALQRNGRHLEPTRDLLDALEPAGVGQDHLGGGEFDAVLQLRRGPPTVQRNRDRAERGGRPERDDVLDTVGRRDRDAVTLADAVLVPQHPGRSSDRAENLPERVAAVRKHHVRPIREALGRGFQQVPQRPLPANEHRHADAEDVLFLHFERRAWADQRVEPFLWHSRGRCPNESCRSRCCCHL